MSYWFWEHDDDEGFNGHDDDEDCAQACPVAFAAPYAVVSPFTVGRAALARGARVEG